MQLPSQISFLMVQLRGLRVIQLLLPLCRVNNQEEDALLMPAQCLDFISALHPTDFIFYSQKFKRL